MSKLKSVNTLAFVARGGAAVPFGTRAENFGIMAGKEVEVTTEDWRDEMSGDPLDLVETEWDAEIERRLQDVLSERVDVVDHAESMRAARERLASRPSRGRAVA